MVVIWWSFGTMITVTSWKNWIYSNKTVRNPSLTNYKHFTGTSRSVLGRKIQTGVFTKTYLPNCTASHLTRLWFLFCREGQIRHELKYKPKAELLLGWHWYVLCQIRADEERVSIESGRHAYQLWRNTESARHSRASWISARVRSRIAGSPEEIQSRRKTGKMAPASGRQIGHYAKYVAWMRSWAAHCWSSAVGNRLSLMRLNK